MKIYEDDSSKEAWKFYKNQYTPSDWDFWEEFDFDNVKTVGLSNICYTPSNKFL